MLIRSQDKQKLVSMDNVVFLASRKERKMESGQAVYSILALWGETEYTHIGKYSTQEKAEAVLDEIQYNYERNKDAEYLGADGPHIRSSIFQMPTDDDPWFDMRNPDQSIDKGTAKHCLAVVEKYIQQNKNAHVATICCGDQQVGLELEEYEYE